MSTILHRTFKRFKQIAPVSVANAVRNTFTAFLTPIMFSYHSGHFRSSFNMKAIDKSGASIPWYTFPCIDFLVRRNFTDKRVLEFGGGQSSIWWGNRARQVISFEGDKAWYDYIKKQMPVNVDLHHVRDENATDCVSDVEKVLDVTPQAEFDVIIIDGLWRYELIPLAISRLAEGGVIICDNSEGYNFREGFDETGFQRIDYYGYASGGILRSCTSLFFRRESFVLHNSNSLETNGLN